MVYKKLITNSPVTPQDVTNAYKIFELDLAELRRKTVRRMPTRINLECIEIPRDIIDQNKMVMLTADIMFVNQISFVITYRRGLGLMMVEWIPNWAAKNLQTSL